MTFLRKSLRQARSRHLRPPPKLTLSEWADRYRFLSEGVAAAHGKWVTDRVPYLRGVLDACSDPDVEQVVFQSSAQIGKTSAVENVLAYFAHQDPSPILLLQPTLEMAEAFSKERLAPMIRDTPVLRAIVRDARAKSGGNTLRHKTFPGGYVALAGANSPASLASRPIRIVLCDEVDRYEASAGTEGDPVTLAFKRTTTFWNRKLILISTPGNKGASRIERALIGGGDDPGSDQRRFWVPCLVCGERQVMTFGPKKPKQPGGVKWPAGEPELAYYECEHCRAAWDDTMRLTAVERGEWRAEQAFRGIAGFHIWEAYSPFSTLARIATSFVKAKEDRETLKVWVNTCLGETFDEQGGQGVEWMTLKDRAEPYAVLGEPEFVLPEGVHLVTAGVDVQLDRLVVVVRGWGRGEESWLLFHGEILAGELAAPIAGGDPVDEWGQLDSLALTLPIRHASGAEMLGVEMMAIDTGFRTQEVYHYARTRRGRVIAVKGSSQVARPVIGAPTKQDVTYSGQKIEGGVELWPVGTDTAKGEIYGRLAIAEGGPRRLHFPQAATDEYFRQLTAEKIVTRFVKGAPVLEWVVQRGRQNHALDAEVYCYAAAIRCGLARMNWDERAAMFAAAGAAAAARRGESSSDTTETAPVSDGVKVSTTALHGRRRRLPTSSWMNR